MVARVHRSHEKIVDAIVRGDIGLARHRMQRDLEAIAPYVCWVDALNEDTLSTE